MAAVPGKRRRSGTGKPADKLICRQRFFLPGKQPQRQPADLGRVLFPAGRAIGGRRAREGRGGGGRESPARAPPPPSFLWQKHHTGVIQAESAQAVKQSSGFESLHAWAFGGSGLHAAPNPLPNPSATGCGCLGPGLGRCLVGGQNLLAQLSQAVPWGGPSLRPLVKSRKKT